MKVTIDTQDKTVIIEEDVNLAELILFLQKSFPAWESYTIKAKQYYPYYPVTIPTTTPYPYYTTCAGDALKNKGLAY